MYFKCLRILSGSIREPGHTPSVGHRSLPPTEYRSGARRGPWGPSDTKEPVSGGLGVWGPGSAPASEGGVQVSWLSALTSLGPGMTIFKGQQTGPRRTETAVSFINIDAGQCHRVLPYLTSRAVCGRRSSLVATSGEAVPGWLPCSGPLITSEGRSGDARCFHLGVSAPWGNSVPEHWQGTRQGSAPTHGGDSYTVAFLEEVSRSACGHP